MLFRSAGAVYRVVAEALLNARRHGEAGRCQVRIEAGDDLVVRVQDDGGGFSEGSRVGVGLTSMAERAAELGGDLHVGPGTEGGTLVEVRLPLEVRT